MLTGITQCAYDPFICTLAQDRLSKAKTAIAVPGDVIYSATVWLATDHSHLLPSYLPLSPHYSVPVPSLRALPISHSLLDFAIRETAAHVYAVASSTLVLSEC